jgi:hypothetical protein
MLSGIGPIKEKQRRKLGVTYTRDITGNVPLLIFMNEPESLLICSHSSVRDSSCPMLSGIGPV